MLKSGLTGYYLRKKNVFPSSRPEGRRDQYRLYLFFASGF